MNNQPLLQLKGISKHFGGLQALDNVDLDLYAGEVLALVGENAAGKSTLIKIITGVYQPSAGEIYFEGKKYEFNSKHDSQAIGIEAIYQTLGLVNELNVASNMFLGKEILKKHLGIFKVLDNKKMERRAQETLKETMGMVIENHKDPVVNMSGGQRQSIAIAKAVYEKAKIVIMDEPTAALGVEEVEKTLNIITELRKNGVSVIFICHTLEHVFRVSDRIFVLNHGKVAGHFDRQDTTIQDVVSLIVAGM